MHRIRAVFIAALLTLGMAVFAAPPAKKAGSKTADTAAASTQKQVDINSASTDELKAVPGIGDAYAAKIIAGRPYKSKAQLKSRNILPAGVYTKVAPYLIAKQK